MSQAYNAVFVDFVVQDKYSLSIEKVSVNLHVNMFINLESLKQSLMV